MQMRSACFVLLIALVLGGQSNTLPSRIIILKIPAGSTSSLWTGVNVSGQVYLSVKSRDGKNKLKLWWIKQPFGQVEQLGDRTNEAKLDIPGLWKATFSAELKASAESDTVVFLGENVQVAQSATFQW
jgi:hypothetical protein